VQVAAEIRMKVHDRTRLTCSVGIAANVMVAKVCSDINKPNGQFEVSSTREAVLDFVRHLPTRKVPGIGKARPRPRTHLALMNSCFKREPFVFSCPRLHCCPGVHASCPHKLLPSFKAHP
jgi:nucleotidyltransferase/DNA polymerase involved in DNA repair